MAQLDITGKGAIVTGAGSGINLKFARLLLQHGANVLFADLALRPEAQSLVDNYQSTPNKAVFKRTDCTSWSDLIAMFDTAARLFSTVDIVCPGAGIYEPKFSNFWYPPGTPLSKDLPEGDRYTTLDLNLTHPIRATQLALAHWLNQSLPSSKTNPKTVVHIASIAGESAGLSHPIYYATKWAISGFVRSLADLQDLHGIRVAAVFPGVVKTPLWTDNKDKLQTVREGEDEWVTPQEVAQVMLDIVIQDEISGKIGEKGSEVTIRGGSCLRVLKGIVEDVPTFGNPGPQSKPGATVTDAKSLYDEVVNQLKPGFGQY